MCSSSTGLGAEAGEELEARTLRDNRKNHAQMWPRDYILGRNGIIQVDCGEVHHPDAEGDCVAGMTAAEHATGNGSIMKSQARCPRPGRIIIFFDKKVNSLGR